MANVCFGCHDTEDIEKCHKKDCVHYGNRNQHLQMDTEVNDARDLMVKRGSRDLMMYSVRTRTI
jgi:hypothetical protein